MAYTEYFAKGTTPTKSCDVHTAVKVCSSTGLLPTATCTTTTKIFVKRPAGSEGTTEDSAYAPPSATCKGHNILDKITDILNPKKDAADMDADDSKKDGATTPGSDANSGSTTTRQFRLRRSFRKRRYRLWHRFQLRRQHFRRWLRRHHGSGRR